MLAPADGVVIETANHFKDSEVIGNGQTDPLIQDIRGNYIVMQHAEDEFSILAHLKPGIEMLFVHADARGKDIGKTLLNYAVDNLGAKFVDVNEQNGQGVGFYMHMGFRVIGQSDFDGQGGPFPLLHLEFGSFSS